MLLKNLNSRVTPLTKVYIPFRPCPCASAPPPPQPAAERQSLRPWKARCRASLPAHCQYHVTNVTRISGETYRSSRVLLSRLRLLADLLGADVLVAALLKVSWAMEPEGIRSAYGLSCEAVGNGTLVLCRIDQ